MPLDLLKVRRVDVFDTKKPGVTLFVITGETVEEHPRDMRLKTFKAWDATLCKRAGETDRLVWITWKDGRPEPFSLYKQADLVKCSLDETKFTYDEAV